MGEENRNGRLEDIQQTIKDYVNLRVDEYKLKGVENFSILSNKVLVILISTMLGAVMLQLLGFAVAFMIGEITGSTALGFGITAIVFAIALIAIYAKRETLFLNRMVKMYVKMFFGNRK
ncbi:MAG: hypothetical protein IKB26_02245 [Bacteroidales bacterium]|nr:hypothetical protein [Bacteroidales bacterium]